MAIMHPSDITKKNHVKSEEKFFNALRDQLSDRYHAFFSVRWYSEDENGQREDSECDFLVFNPDYGFLCIEVKGGRGICVDENGDWFLKQTGDDRKLKQSPYLQAEKSMRFFKKYYEDELETFFPGIYGSAVAFPNYNITSPLTVDSPLALTIDLDDMGNLARRIVEIFRYFNVNKSGKSSFMAPDSQKKFINLINKRIALSIAAGALIEEKERELVEINYTQNVVIDLLANYPRAFIVGGAGTGKTWIGIKKIRQCILSGKDALYLCCNRVLANVVRTHIGSEKASVYCMDDFAKDILGEKVENAKIVNGCKEYSELISKVDNIGKFDLVVVDEAQDFTEDWAFCANLLTNDNGELYVFYDESQNVFSRHFGDKFYIDAAPYVLRYNIRNTSNIYQYTQDRTCLGLDTLINQIEGVEPDIRTISRKQQVLAFIDSTVNKLVNKEGVAADKITILCNRQKKESILGDVEWVGGYRISEELLSTGTIKFSTVEEFKGLESDIIIYINYTYKNEPITDDVRSIQYTALTRARFYLYVIDYETEI